MYVDGQGIERIPMPGNLERSQVDKYRGAFRKTEDCRFVADVILNKLKPGEPKCFSILRVVLWDRLSTAQTVYPFASRVPQRFEPIKPAAPVTSIFPIDTLSKPINQRTRVSRR